MGLTPDSVGSTQPQLTAPGSSEDPGSKAAPVRQTETAQPAYEYIVRTAAVQQGMSSQSTQVVLESVDKKIITAFARGNHPDLVPGTKLSGVKLATRRQDTVVFHVLEAYQVVAPQPQAA